MGDTKEGREGRNDEMEGARDESESEAVGVGESANSETVGVEQSNRKPAALPFIT
jgi:hypothetical protein